MTKGATPCSWTSQIFRESANGRRLVIVCNVANHHEPAHCSIVNHSLVIDPLEAVTGQPTYCTPAIGSHRCVVVEYQRANHLALLVS
jgi:hypothetical protein